MSGKVYGFRLFSEFILSLVHLHTKQFWITLLIKKMDLADIYKKPVKNWQDAYFISYQNFFLYYNKKLLTHTLLAPNFMQETRDIVMICDMHINVNDVMLHNSAVTIIWSYVCNCIITSRLIENLFACWRLMITTIQNTRLTVIIIHDTHINDNGIIHCYAATMVNILIRIEFVYYWQFYRIFGLFKLCISPYTPLKLWC